MNGSNEVLNRLKEADLDCGFRLYVEEVIWCMVIHCDLTVDNAIDVTLRSLDRLNQYMHDTEYEPLAPYESAFQLLDRPISIGPEREEASRRWVSRQVDFGRWLDAPTVHSYPTIPFLRC